MTPITNVSFSTALPLEFIERARAAGLNVETLGPDQVFELLETYVLRLEAGQRLGKIAEKLQSGPLESRITPEEIDEEIRAFWAERDEDML
jgi:hypothetical protein